MNQTERVQFAVRLGLANSFRVFLRNISSDAVVAELLDAAKSRHVALQVLERVLSLSRRGVDFRYLHRYDIPLATYLWLLSRTWPEFALAGAEAVANLPRIWWAEQVARYILQALSRKSDTAAGTPLLRVSGNWANVSTSNVAAGMSQIIHGGQSGFASPQESSRSISTGTAKLALRESADTLNSGPAFDFWQDTPTTTVQNR
jgi:hypothetical protein